MIHSKAKYNLSKFEKKTLFTVDDNHIWYKKDIVFLDIVSSAKPTKMDTGPVSNTHAKKIELRSP